MALARSVYNLLFRRTSSFAVTIMVGAVFFEQVFDQTGDAILNQLNKGKLWKHNKHKYEAQDEEYMRWSGHSSDTVFHALLTEDTTTRHVPPNLPEFLQQTQDCHNILA